MNEIDRLLNLDCDDTVEVTLGGKQFTIKQQRKALIERVVRLVYLETGTDEDKELTNEQTVQLLFDNWEKSLPAFALILGVEPEDTAYKETMAHLEEHLTFAKAQILFNRWYELNEVERFFAFLGNPLIPMRTYQRLLQEQIVEAVNSKGGELVTSSVN